MYEEESYCSRSRCGGWGGYTKGGGMRIQGRFMIFIFVTLYLNNSCDNMHSSTVEWEMNACWYAGCPYLAHSTT